MWKTIYKLYMAAIYVCIWQLYRKRDRNQIAPRMRTERSSKL